MADKTNINSQESEQEAFELFEGQVGLEDVNEPDSKKKNATVADGDKQKKSNEEFRFDDVDMGEEEEEAADSRTIIRHLPSVEKKQNGKSPKQSVEIEKTAEDMERELQNDADRQVAVWRTLSISIMAIVVIFFMMWFYKEYKEIKLRTEGGQEASVTEESAGGSYKAGKIVGVVESNDEESVVIYSADGAETKTFSLINAKNLLDSYGSKIAANDIEPGTVVDVDYNADTDIIETLRLTAQESKFKNVTSFTFENNILTIGGTEYEVDDRLICTDRGENFDGAGLKKGMVFNVAVSGNHVYTIRVLYSVGTIVLSDISYGYNGAILYLTPQNGPAVTFPLTVEKPEEESTEESGTESGTESGAETENVQEAQSIESTESTESTEESETDPLLEGKIFIETTEGINEYIIIKDGTILDEGSVLVPGEEQLDYVLPSIAERNCQLLVDIKAANAKIYILDTIVNAEGEIEYIEDKELVNHETANLSFGTYMIRVASDGYETRDIKFEVKEAYSVFSVDLDASTTKVKVYCMFAGTDLYINDVYAVTMSGRGETFDLAYGEYSFRMEKKGCYPVVVTLTIEANTADQVIYFEGFRVNEESGTTGDSSGEESGSESESQNESGESHEESGQESYIINFNGKRDNNDVGNEHC